MPEEVIVFGPEWKLVIEELRLQDEELPHKAHEETRQLAEKYAQKAVDKVNSLPTPSNAGHTGLRARVGAGVHVVDTDLAGIRVVTSMDNPSERIIPRGLDSPGTGWKHPLFGDRNHWFRNEGYSWFRETFSDSHDDFERNLTDVIENSAHRIADAGGTHT